MGPLEAGHHQHGGLTAVELQMEYVVVHSRNSTAARRHTAMGARPPFRHRAQEASCLSRENARSGRGDGRAQAAPLVAGVDPAVTLSVHNPFDILEAESSFSK